MGTRTAPVEPLSGPKAWALRVAGLLFLGLAGIGVVLPLMPATCFLLVSAGCFGRSSPRLYHWMHHNPVFGKLLRDYRDHRVIPIRIKVASVAVLWVTMGITLVLVPNWIVRVIIIAIGVTITAHVVSVRHRAIPEAPLAAPAGSAEPA
ncbi:MAG: YbaN family protein [Gemmatimonadetes bacterium]|nr:YbaN family protein [Gemmatimonadota bacterium]